MPNHVHLLIQPLAPVPVLMRWLKGSTARWANQVLNRTGHSFWQEESWDHYVTTEKALARDHLLHGSEPRLRRLVRSLELWRWSSAGWPGQ
jgi:REP element-mobilizing transposase RayT